MHGAPLAVGLMTWIASITILNRSNYIHGRGSVCSAAASLVSSSSSSFPRRENFGVGLLPLLKIGLKSGAVPVWGGAAQPQNASLKPKVCLTHLTYNNRHEKASADVFAIFFTRNRWQWPILTDIFIFRQISQNADWPLFTRVKDRRTVGQAILLVVSRTFTI